MTIEKLRTILKIDSSNLSDKELENLKEFLEMLARLYIKNGAKMLSKIEKKEHN